MTQAPLSLDPPIIPVRLTLERYHLMVNSGALDDLPVELLDGELVQMSPEGEPHAYYRTDAKNYLIALLGDRILLREGAPITLPRSNSEPEPDIAIVEPLGREYLQHHPYPENIFWVIEYSNTSLRKDLDVKSNTSLRKDLDVKSKTYASAGILEYWVINLRSMELIVMRDPVNGVYQSQVTLTQGILYPVAFSNVAVDVLRLLA
jgi:Uma2 family endonuclease